MDYGTAVETCRVCATCFPTNEMEFINIFNDCTEFNEELLFIRNEIQSWQLQIIPNDGLPQSICANCFARFCYIDGFRQECIQAQEYLTQAMLALNICNATHDQQQPDDSLTEDQLCMPMLGNISTNSESAILIHSTVSSTQCEVILNESLEQNFPQLMDASATLLVNQVIDKQNNNSSKTIVATITPDLNEANIKDLSSTDNIIADNKLILPAKQTTATMEDFEDLLQHSIILNKSLQVNDEVNEEEEKEVIPAGEPYTCSYCDCTVIRKGNRSKPLSFPDADQLSQHFFAVHDPKRPYTCPACVNTYTAQNLRDHHYRLEHLPSTNKKCPFCFNPTESNMEEHYDKCFFTDDWECDTCQEQFIDISLKEFRQHQRQHDSDDDNCKKHFQCRFCEKTFVRQANLQAHEKSHTAKGNLPICQICNIAFKNIHELKHHNCLQHNGEPPIKCDRCHKAFITIQTLRSHLQNVHKLTKVERRQYLLKYSTKNKINPTKNFNNSDNNSPEKEKSLRKCYTCCQCSLRFRWKSQLETHLNTHYIRPLSHQCQHCYRRYGTLIELKTHMNIKHGKPKQFICLECGKCFEYENALNEHILLHHNVHNNNTEMFIGKNNCNEIAIQHPQQPHIVNEEYADYSNCRSTNNFIVINYNNNNNDNDKEEIPLITQSNIIYSSNGNNNAIAETAHMVHNGKVINNSTHPTLTNKVDTTQQQITNTTDLSLNIFNGNLITPQLSTPLLYDNHSEEQNANYNTTATTVPVSAVTVPHTTNDIFLIPNENGQFDQYFVASLLDPEQEVIVT